MNYRNQKGQALVELALVIFLLFLLVFGVTEFGRAMYIWNTLNNSARAGVREAVVTRPLNITGTTYPLTLSSTCTETDRVLSVACRSGRMNGVLGTLQVNVEIRDAISGNSKLIAATGDEVRVSVTLTDFQPIVSFIQITNTLQGNASMRYE